ncbi:hypothetical protein C8A05DRAFT_33767 [Staphylotrichum tortipilum]|uniref:Ubiquitin-like 1-activating enzyme E1A n=1 Tax=Staphylotrichum tortipilum TaxID=2831512 RepID=A0AAN6RT78_9PEZI|nr:hypothetical protein C8A05DRAFT_33767 [Staphylotrichum longicolle]
MATTTNDSGPAQANGISADEIALYDRQIRLWGMQAQEKIRSANILLVTIKAMGNEIAKNLVLAGIGSLTILDGEPVTPADLGAQFLLSEHPQPEGVPRALAAAPALQRLNPRVRILPDASDVHAKPPSFFAPFDIIIATDLPSPALSSINAAARAHNRPFYAAASHGLHGFLFADLDTHDFILSRARSNIPTTLGAESRTRSVLSVVPKPGDEKHTELVTKREVYTPWSLATSRGATLPAEILRSPRRRRVVTPILSCFRAWWELQTHPPTAHDERARLAEFTRLCAEHHAALGLPAETLRSDVLRAFLQNAPAQGLGSPEIAPVAAVLGGQLAQDVINVLGRTQQPVQNFVVFDGEGMEAGVFALHPEEMMGVGGEGGGVKVKAAEVKAAEVVVVL